MGADSVGAPYVDEDDAELVVVIAALDPETPEEVDVVFTTDDVAGLPLDTPDDVSIVVLLEADVADAVDDSELCPVEDDELTWLTVVEVEMGPGAVGTKLLDSSFEDEEPLATGPTEDPFVAMELDDGLKMEIAPVE